MEPFTKKILERIESEHVEKYSKAHFAARVVLLALVAILTLIVSVCLFNFVFFTLRASGREILFGFGSRGVLFFFEFFPWMLLAIDIVLILILEALLRNFRFGYRKPALYLLLILLAVGVSGGFILDRAGWNDALLHRADRHQLFFPFANFYEGARLAPLPDQGICKCTVTAVKGNTITAEDVDENSTTTYTIILPEGFPASSTLKVGDVIFVAGDVTASGTIRAFGIRLLPPNDIEVPEPCCVPGR